MIKKTIKCTYKAISKDFGSVYRWFKDDYDWCMDNIMVLLNIIFLSIVSVLPLIITGVLLKMGIIQSYMELPMILLTCFWAYILVKYIDCSDYWCKIFETGFK